MCTAITLGSQSNEFFFGRTMDFSHDIIPQFFTLPQFFTWINPINGNPVTDSFRILGLAQEEEGNLVFFDGVNEKGFAAAALYFAGNAKYSEPSANSSKESVSSLDFLHYILGKCSSTKDLPLVLQNISITGIPDPVTNTIAPLHWIAADRDGSCVVIEPTERGIELTSNPIGVMANSPNFHWHMTNLRNYMAASPTQTEEASWGGTTLTPFGQAGGTTVLPGGFTSPERFVRAAYLKTHIPTPKGGQEAIPACFHIMESVSIPKGAVVTSRNTYDYTKYVAFINLSTCEYFYKTYDDLNIRMIGLR